MKSDYFHEVESVDICSRASRPLSELTLVFRDLGFTFHDDIVSLDRQENVPPWQHPSIVEIQVLCRGEEVFGFEAGEWDTIRVNYLFASLPFDLADNFIEVSHLISKKLSLPLEHAGEIVDEMWLRERFARIRQELLDHTGEEPGSEGLAILIRSRYPRR